MSECIQCGANCGYLTIPKVYRLGQGRLYDEKFLFPYLFVFRHVTYYRESLNVDVVRSNLESDNLANTYRAR